MISVLIPVYNYNIVALVSELHRQLSDTKLPFEIHCGDDASDPNFVMENKVINDLPYTTYHISDYNTGREQTRQALSEKANYNWLLFLDADTFPVKSDFIKNYIPYLTSDYDAIFGGILYQQESPHPDFMLRWKYGIKNESVNAETRNQNSFQAVVSANFFIKSDVFKHTNGKISGKQYGYDILFGSLLKSNHQTILHIDNEVYHLGIENSIQYLQKKEAAAETYLDLFKNGDIGSEDSKLLSLFLKLKRYKLNYVMSMLFNLFQPVIKRNLLGKHPNIKLLQLYRIGYLCYIDIKSFS